MLILRGVDISSVGVDGQLEGIDLPISAGQVAADDGHLQRSQGHNKQAADLYLQHLIIFVINAGGEVGEGGRASG